MLLTNKSINRILEYDSSLNKSKKGFPSVGKRPDGRDFSDSVKKIADAWDVYDNQIYNLDIAKNNNISTLNLGGGNPAKTNPFPMCIKYLKSVLGRKSLFEYPPAAGDEFSRNTIVEYLKKEGFCNDAELSIDNTIITVSTSHAFSLILDVIARPYDVILMTGPNYGLFTFPPERINATVEILNLRAEDNWYISPNLLEHKINEVNEELEFKYRGELTYIPRVVAFLNQNPHNPTGKVMGKKQIDLLRKIGEICTQNGVFIIDDLIYRDLTFDRNNLALPIATIPEYFSNTISLLGLSKSYGLASFRAGCVVADEVVIRGLRNKLFHMMDSPPVLQAVALMGAYNATPKRYRIYKKYFNSIIKEYKYRFELLKALVEGIDKIQDSSLKIKIIKDIEKIIKDKVQREKIFKGIPYARLVENMDPEAGFFALIDFTELRGKQYNDFKIIDEKQLLLFLYNECKLKFIIGQSISWPYSDQIIARVTFALEREELINIFKSINLTISKLI